MLRIQTVSPCCGHLVRPTGWKLSQVVFPLLLLTDTVSKLLSYIYANVQCTVYS